MKPLIVLIVTFIISLLVIKLTSDNWNFPLSGNCAMAAMLIFTAIGHFAFTKGMAMMLPTLLPLKTAIVYITGGIEIAAAIGLLIPSVRIITAVLLIVFFVLILPGNIYAALHKVDYQKATFTGAGNSYLWFRIPLQLIFILWVYSCNFLFS